MLDSCYMCLNQMARVPMQLELRPRAWGGRRAGAGRKPSGRKVGVPHRTRAPHQPRHPAHVTLRAQRVLPSLRGDRLFRALCRGLLLGSRGGLRVLQFSVQRDHLHLIVEAEDGHALSRGIQGLAIRLAKAVNRVLRRRGRVWGDRYHVRALNTPREVRNALVYVLQNWRKHMPGSGGVDPCSSAAWFSGWGRRIPVEPTRSPVVAPRTWLAAVGWQRYGLIGEDEAPVRLRRGKSANRRVVSPLIWPPADVGYPSTPRSCRRQPTAGGEGACVDM